MKKPTPQPDNAELEESLNKMTIKTTPVIFYVVSIALLLLILISVFISQALNSRDKEVSVDIDLENIESGKFTT